MVSFRGIEPPPAEGSHQPLSADLEEGNAFTFRSIPLTIYWMSLTEDLMYPNNLSTLFTPSRLLMEFSLAEEQSVSLLFSEIAVFSFALAPGGRIHGFNPYKNNAMVKTAIKIFALRSTFIVFSLTI